MQVFHSIHILNIGNWKQNTSIAMPCKQHGLEKVSFDSLSLYRVKEVVVLKIHPHVPFI